MAADPPRVLVVAGPTAAGKTAAAIAAATAVGGVVVGADAMQVYRGMDIGTAKATPEERAGIVHEGLDLVDPDAPFDVEAWLALADAVIARGQPVIVAGGTGLYLHALRRGLVTTPAVDPVLRAELEAEPHLHALLGAVDPALAARLHPHDRVRLIRGVEVFRQTGERLSDLQAAHAGQPDRVAVTGVFLDRPDLDTRIDARVEQMIAQGYVDEVRALLDAGFAPTLRPMRSLGYRHLADHLLHDLPLDEAVRRTQRDTRRFARKQRTWQNTLQLQPARGGEVEAVVGMARGVFP
ncbi:MAG: tRNA (adenosine(37)-N6)-dimethylallyltransferase MiaA [Alphaproteobacteria bacterium]|nr:tRNA (adenosine(37)-N6)-dimethylallyltransferase MiaA [Alphaproteobacteria bacterium]